MPNLDRDYLKKVQENIFKMEQELEIPNNLNSLMLNPDTKKQVHCQICPKTFRLNSHLRRHFLVHWQDKQELCKFCGESFPKGGLKVHMQSHSKQEQFVCHECGKSFERNCDLQAHELLHSILMRFLCEVCSKPFTHRGSLNKHMASHSQEKNFLCEVCSKSFAQRCHLRKHMLIHEKEETYICEVCAKSFTQSRNFKVHMLTHSRDNLLSCEICFKTFTQRSSLGRHMKTHAGEIKFKCRVCRKPFTQESILKEHMLSHSGEKAFKCQLCSLEFRRKCNLKKHTLTHNQENGFRFEAFTNSTEQEDSLMTKVDGEKNLSSCDLNNESYKKNSIVEHTFVQQNRKKKFICQVCNKEFTRNEHLKRHVAIVHNGERNFHCQLCSKSFGEKRGLRLHVLFIHSGEKKIGRSEEMISRQSEEKITDESGEKSVSYSEENSLNHSKEDVPNRSIHKRFSCQICNKRFKSNYHLLRHTPFHTGEKNFQCELCTKSYAEKGSLMSHIVQYHSDQLKLLNHIGENPLSIQSDFYDFSCQLCKKVFKSKSDLNKHTETHTAVTGEIQFKCLLCSETFTEKGTLKSHIMSTHGEEYAVSYGGDDDTSLEIKDETLNENRDSAEGVQYSEEKAQDHKSGQSIKRRFSCQVCNKTFKSHNHLSRHIVVHTGERRFHCELCTKSYLEKRSLMSHIMLNHSEGDGGEYLSSQVEEISEDYVQLETLDSVEQSISYKEENILKNALENKSYESEEQFISCIDENSLNLSIVNTTTSHWIREKRFLCQVCKKRFKSNYHLHRHNRVHTGEKNAHCELCPKSFAEKRSLMLHIMNRHCEEKTLGDDLENLSLNQTDDYDYVCQVCKKAFRSNYDLNRHAQVHTGERQFHCDVCSKSFTEKSTLKSHMMSKHSEEYSLGQGGKNTLSQYEEKISEDTPNSGEETESYCEENTGTLNGSIEDMLSKSRDKTLCCEICKRTFRYNCHLKRHNLIHTGEKPFQCELCPKSYTEKGSLMSHVMMQHNEDMPLVIPSAYYNYFCQVCKKAFRSNYDLNRHAQVHTGKRQFQCDVCSNSFTEKSTLKSHMMSKHRKEYTLDESEEKTFNCHMCNETFRSRFQLCRHLPIHQMNKTFVVCKFCNESFTETISLRLHIRSEHTIEKRFNCPECNKTFRSNYHLKRHMPNHNHVKQLPRKKCSRKRRRAMFSFSKEKRFSCRMCNKRFDSNYYLKRHMPIHQNDDFALCGESFTEKDGGELCSEFFTEKDDSEFFKEKDVDELCSEFLKEKDDSELCGESFTEKDDSELCSEFFKEKDDSKLCDESFTVEDAGEFCSKSVIENDSLGSLIKSCHSVEKICKKIFKLRHVPVYCKRKKKSIDDKQKNYVCHTCNKVFKSLSNLNKHKREFHDVKGGRHREKSKFQCRICRCPFKKEVIVNYHVEFHRRRDEEFEAFADAVHGYSCGRCCQTFDTINNLVSHFNLHLFAEQNHLVMLQRNC